MSARGAGYAATGDLSRAGLQAALELAADRARASAAASLIDHRRIARPMQSGEYRSPDYDTSLPGRGAWLDLLARECAGARLDPRIVERVASARLMTIEQYYLTSDGIRVDQRLRRVMPYLAVTAHADGDTQRRTLGIHGSACLQGGLGVLAQAGFDGSGATRRARSVATARRAELPERAARSAADARPDGATDPRIDRSSARARPDPR